MSHPTPEQSPEPIRLTAHPPERRRRSSVIAAQACCCCCCCCCLHTIGGLVGALVGSVIRLDPTPRYADPDAEFPFRRDEELPTFVVPASLVYWVVFSLASGLAWTGYVLYQMSGAPNSQEMIEGAVILIMLLPVVQLLASILALIVVALLPRSVSPDRPVALRRVGFITLWSFVGTMVGTLIMLLPFLPALFQG
jgi:hypothetical protein